MDSYLCRSLLNITRSASSPRPTSEGATLQMCLVDDVAAEDFVSSIAGNIPPVVSPNAPPCPLFLFRRSPYAVSPARHTRSPVSDIPMSVNSKNRTPFSTLDDDD